MKMCKKLETPEHITATCKGKGNKKGFIKAENGHIINGYSFK